MSNKKLNTHEIIGGPGISVSSYDNNMTSQYLGGEYFDITKTQTMVQLDLLQLQGQMDMHLTGGGRQTILNTLQPSIEAQVQQILKEKVRFEVISWFDEVGQPGATCQIYFNDKLIAEKSSDKDGTHENPEI